jgi:hypothetical protein
LETHEPWDGKHTPSSSQNKGSRQVPKHEQAHEDILHDIRVNTVQRHVTEASRKYEEMGNARLQAELLGGQAGQRESDAREHLQVTENTVLAAEQARLDAETLEAEARRKRQEAEQAEWRALDERASAQRDHHSAVHSHQAAKLACTKAQADLEDAEKEQEVLVAALARLMEERRERQSHSSSSSNPHRGGYSEKHASSAANENARRAEELEESIRKMRAFNEEAKTRQKATTGSEGYRSASATHDGEHMNAEASRREREREEQSQRERAATAAAATAAQQRKREAEAAAIKQKEKEDHEKAELDRLKELERQRAWKNATDAEIHRCTERDQAMWPKKGRWSKESALSRFQLISDDFDSRRFSVEVPLTVGAIPWPILRVPFALDIKTEIDWKAVDDFFGAAKAAMTAQEYTALLEKSRKRFHPDRWRARKLFVTVMDEGMRVQLEAVVNIVSQAINSIVNTMKNTQ